METNRTIGAPYDIPETLEFQIFYNLNFLELIINIPSSIIKHSELQKRNDFLNNLKDCHFCGKKALLAESCLLCKESLDRLLSSRINKYLKYYNNIAKIIDQHKRKTEDFIEYSNDLNFFYHNDYFI